MRHVGIKKSADGQKMLTNFSEGDIMRVRHNLIIDL